MINQQLKLDGDKVILRNTIEDNPVAKSAREVRAEHNLNGNAKGWMRERTMMHAARIPVEAFLYDNNLVEFSRLRSAGNKEAASRYLIKFLQENPQFRCSEARL